MLLHVARPKAHAPNGNSIIVLQEAYGVNEYLLGIAERFANLGIATVAPELYHRNGESRLGGPSRTSSRGALIDAFTIPEEVLKSTETT